MRLGAGHVLWLRACVESISRAGMQLSEGRRRGCKESRKESEKVVKGFLHPKRKCPEVVNSDVGSFILLA